MKIAIISDIHGNLVALQSILSELQKADRVVCLGDVAAVGPQPHETISFLRRARWPCVLGNTDETLAKSKRELHAQIPEGDREKMVSLDEWTISAINAADREFLSGFKPTIEVKGGKISLLCYHGSPRSNTEQILPTTSTEVLDRIFEGKNAQVYVGGHIHSQMVRKFRTSMIINPGSVGLPFIEFADGRSVNPSWAEYAILTTSGNDLKLELRRERYNKRDLKDAVRKSGMPDPDWWLRDWV